MESQGKSKKRTTIEEAPEEETRSPTNLSQNIASNDSANMLNEGIGNPMDTDDSNKGINATDSKNVMRGTIFSIDYSKRGTAKCKVCKKAIDRHELRLGKLVPYKTEHIIRYLHVDCAFNSFRRARLVSNVVKDSSELDGFELIKVDDKILIKQRIESENATRKTLLENPKPKTQKCEAPARIRKLN